MTGCRLINGTATATSGSKVPNLWDISCTYETHVCDMQSDVRGEMANHGTRYLSRCDASPSNAMRTASHFRSTLRLSCTPCGLIFASSLSWPSCDRVSGSCSRCFATESGVANTARCVSFRYRVLEGDTAGGRNGFKRFQHLRVPFKSDASVTHLTRFWTIFVHSLPQV